MSTEIAAILAIHWWKAVIVTVCGFFGWKLQEDYRAKESRLQKLEDWREDSYSKDATEKLIDSKLEVPKEKLSKLEEVVSNFITSQEQNQLRSDKRSDERDERLLQKLNELTDKFSKMETSIAVIENDIQHLTKNNKEK